jgi:hypothetical protein
MPARGTPTDSFFPNPGNPFNELRQAPLPTDAFYGSVHIIGHGLGAHLGSYVCETLKVAGGQLQNTLPVVGRLTGKIS